MDEREPRTPLPTSHPGTSLQPTHPIALTAKHSQPSLLRRASSTRIVCLPWQSLLHRGIQQTFPENLTHDRGREIWQWGSDQGSSQQQEPKTAEEGQVWRCPVGSWCNVLTEQLQHCSVSSHWGLQLPLGECQGWRVQVAVALPTSPARAAPSGDAHSLLLQQQAHSFHSSFPSKCLNHTMDSPATGFCSSGSSPGNESSFLIPMPLLSAINLPQKNGPWRQQLWAA